LRKAWPPKSAVSSGTAPRRSPTCAAGSTSGFAGESGPRFELTDPAEQDLEEIFFEVKERHDLLVAERVYSNLLHKFDLLADMPEMGRHRALAASVFASGRPPAYIAYRSDVRPTRIVRIARASRDRSRFAPAPRP